MTRATRDRIIGIVANVNDFEDRDFAIRTTMSMQITMSCSDYGGSSDTKPLALPGHDEAFHIFAASCQV